MSRRTRTVVVTLPQTDEEFAAGDFATDTHRNAVMRMSTHGVLCIEDGHGDPIQFYPEGTWIGSHVVR